MEDTSSSKSKKTKTPFAILENDFSDLLKKNKASIKISPDDLKRLEMTAAYNFESPSQYSSALASSVLYKILVTDDLSYAQAQKVLIGDMNWAEAGIRLGITNQPYNLDPMTTSTALRTGIEKNYLKDADANLVFDEVAFFASNLPVFGPIAGNALSLIGLAADLQAYTNNQLVQQGGDLWPYSSGKPPYTLSLQDVYKTISLNEKKAFAHLSNSLYNDTLTYTVYDTILDKENFKLKGYEITNSILTSLDAKNQADNLDKNLSKDELAKINEDYAKIRNIIIIDSEGLHSKMDKYSKNSQIDEIERESINNTLLDMYNNAFMGENNDVERLGVNLLGAQSWLDQRHKEYYDTINLLRNDPTTTDADIKKAEEDHTKLVSRYAIAVTHDIFPQLELKASTAHKKMNSKYIGYSIDPSMMHEATGFIESIFSRRDKFDYDSFNNGIYYPYLQSFDTSTPISDHMYEYGIPNILTLFSWAPSTNPTDMTIASLKEYYKNNKDGVVPSYLIDAEYFEKLHDIMETGTWYGYSNSIDWGWAQQEDSSNIKTRSLPIIQTREEIRASLEAIASKFPPDVQKKVDIDQAVEDCYKAQFSLIPNSDTMTSILNTNTITSTPTPVPLELHALNENANGGRATEASIFGEAGPEWAIPERHDVRTAELLNSAREASGFSWTELIASTGGLNGGGNVISNNITYAPVVHANDVSGVEDVLVKDKQMLDDWWKQKQWEMARTQWA